MTGEDVGGDGDERGGAGRRRAPRIPDRQAGFADVPLDVLRAYRRHLTEEEIRVSYWRRLMQARSDLLSVGADLDEPRVDALRTVLVREHARARHGSLLRTVPTDDIPPLPDVVQLWDALPDAADESGRAALLAELRWAEQQLSEYRRALHRRLDTATRELVARYWENPALALEALPLPPTMSTSARPSGDDEPVAT